MPVSPERLIQAVPPSVEYCHVPVPAPVTLVPVIAIPSFPSVSATVLPRNELTACPVFAVWSSVIVVRVGLPATRVGAEFDPVQFRANEYVEVEVSAPPPDVPPSSCTLKLKVVLLLVAVEVNCNFPAAMSAALIAWFAVTATPLYVIEPRPGSAVITTFLIAFPSTSVKGKSVDLKV